MTPSRSASMPKYGQVVRHSSSQSSEEWSLRLNKRILHQHTSSHGSPDKYRTPPTSNLKCPVLNTLLHLPTLIVSCLTSEGSPSSVPARSATSSSRSSSSKKPQGQSTISPSSHDLYVSSFIDALTPTPDISTLPSATKGEMTNCILNAGLARQGT